MSNGIVKSSNKQRGRRISEEKWNDYRKTILELWLTDDLPLEEVVKKLWTIHGLAVTTDQLHHRIVKKWSIRKNITKNEWRKLYWNDVDRREAGDGRNVLFNGRLITDETKAREWERYSFASEARTGALSPLPEIFKYRVMRNTRCQDMTDHSTDASMFRRDEPHKDSLAVNTPMHITPILSQIVLIPSGLTLLDASASHPFKWAFRFDWNVLTKVMGSNNQLVQMCELDSSRLNAMFYTQHLLPLTATAATGPLVFQYLLSSVINGVDYRTREGSDAYRQLTAFPRPAVLAILRTLPTDTVNVIRYRLRSAAVKDNDPDRVECLLELERGLCADGFCTNVEIAFVLDSLQACDKDVAIAIVQYASRASRKQDSVLSQVISVLETCGSMSWRRLHIVGLIEILVRAGASLTHSCFLLEGHTVDTLDSLIALEEGDILTWIQNQLLIRAVENLAKDPFAPEGSSTLVRWIISALKRAYYNKTALGMWTELDSKVVGSELPCAFRAALRRSLSWVVETIYDTSCQLGYTLCYSQGDPHLDRAVMQACKNRCWRSACDAVKDLNTANLNRADFNLTYRMNDATATRAMKEAVRAEDFTKIEELLSNRVSSEAVVREALNAGRNSVAAWAATYGNFAGITVLLERAHANVISILLLRHSHCAEALQATDRGCMTNSLEDILYRRLPHERCRRFPCFLNAPQMESHQIVLRVLSYHAIYNDDIDLLVWLQSHGLAAGNIRNMKNRIPLRLCGNVSQKEKLLSSAYPDKFETRLPSLLYIAIRYRRTKILSYLLNRTLPNRESDTLLYAVTSRAPLDTIELLLLAGHHEEIIAKVQYGSAALRFAIRDKNYDLLRILAPVCDTHGLEKVFSDKEGFLDFLDPFGEAVLRSDCTAVKILLENGSDPNTIVAFEGLQEHAPRSVVYSVLWRMTPLLVAIDIGNYTMVQFLVDNGAEIDPELTGGLMRTPLQRASEIGDFDLVQLFIAREAVIDSALVYGGATALQLAAMSGHVGIATFLIQHGANVNNPPSRGPGRTAFEAAAEWCRPDMMHLLVQNGAQLDLEIEGEFEEQGEQDGMFSSKYNICFVWRTVRKTRTQYERALQFAEDRKEYASKTIVENIGRRLGLHMCGKFLEIAD